ncbi:MAG: GDP-mannose mannosyl hydrolase [Verrucomicrobia subdivision 3 bacterium]|nr:GDP-mannose mannosyl hydrolase [Limisphaerales bacterium]
MWLGRQEFLEVVERTPLVSIDLIVRRRDGAVLLGKRTNEPAKGCWFVPGGRICKDERIEAAFRRICVAELGREFNVNNARFMGVFEHFYPTNFAEQAGISTHYIVLAHELNSIDLPDQLPADQHGEYRWFDTKTLLATAEIHAHTKAYFMAEAAPVNGTAGKPASPRPWG